MKEITQLKEELELEIESFKRITKQDLEDLIELKYDDKLCELSNLETKYINLLHSSCEELEKYIEENEDEYFDINYELKETIELSRLLEIEMKKDITDKSNIFIK